MSPITIDITILKSVDKVWDYFTKPEHITEWNFATDEWVCPAAKNNFEVGGAFDYRMEAKDGSFGFDYTGVFDEIVPLKKINYLLDDGRKVEVIFESLDPDMTKVTEIFEPDPEQPPQMQREGWYGILNNFHKYVENN